MATLTPAELTFCQGIRTKDRRLREFLQRQALPETVDPRLWLSYLSGIKAALGNLNNDLGFISTLIIKDYLLRRFGILDFDAAGKPQGAAGLDVSAVAPNGYTIVGELKTTKPYQPGFGAAQRAAMRKDLARLSVARADHRFMFVIDADAFMTLCKPSFARHASGIEIVDLVSGATFLCPQGEPSV